MRIGGSGSGGGSTDLTTVNSRLSALESTDTTHTSNIATHTTQIGNLQSADTGLDTRITSLEGGSAITTPRVLTALVGAALAVGTLTATGAVDFDSSLNVDGSTVLRGTTDQRGALSNSTGDLQVSDNLIVTGTTDQRTSVSNSTGTLALSDDTTFGVDASSTLSFTNSAQGAYLNYDGKYGEVKEEFLMRHAYASTGNSSWLSCSFSGTGAGCSVSGVAATTGRIGLQRMSRGTTATGRGHWFIDNALITTDGTFSTRAVWNPATASDATNGYSVQHGFVDTTTTLTHTNGCFVTYDERNVLGANASNTAKLVFSCCKAGACQHKLLDGTTTCDGSFTSVSTTVTPGSFIETDIRMNQPDSLVELYADTGSGLTKRCQVTTSANIPTGTIGLALSLMGSGGTTDRTVDVDYMDFRWLLTTARSP